MATSDNMREQIQSLTEKFDGLDKKVDGLGLRVGGLELKVDGLGQRVGSLEQKVDLLPTRDDLTGFKDEIINNFRILAEDAKASARNAAEGYDATLKKIERDLVELNQKVDNQLSDHGRVLANHNERLAALEPQQRL